MASITAPSSAALPTQVNGEDVLYEVVNGQYVELPPMGAYQTFLASRLAFYLNLFADQNRLGRAVQEMLFVLDAVQDLRRRPDVAFVSFRRWPKHRRVPDAEAWEIVPDLAVEVISRSNTSKEDIQKVNEYFRAGVERVWLVYPNVQQVYIYESPTQVHILTVAGEILGEPVVPGFRLPLASLFEVESAGDATATTV